MVPCPNQGIIHRRRAMLLLKQALYPQATTAIGNRPATWMFQTYLKSSFSINFRNLQNSYYLSTLLLFRIALFRNFVQFNGNDKGSELNIIRFNTVKSKKFNESANSGLLLLNLFHFIHTRQYSSHKDSIQRFLTPKLIPCHGPQLGSKASFWAKIH